MKMMTNLQNKLLDLTCTHANQLHATDCKDCIQLVNDITELFIDEGYVKIPQVELRTKGHMTGEPAIFTINGVVSMTGQEWYDRFEEEWVSEPIILNSGYMETAEDWITKIDARVKETAKLASGIGEPQDD
jgi:hypothetical protein